MIFVVISIANYGLAVTLRDKHYLKPTSKDLFHWKSLAQWSLDPDFVGSIDTGVL